MSVLETRGPSDEKKFDKLESDWKDLMASSESDAVKAKISEIASFEELNQQELKANPEINQLKDSLSSLMEPYKESSKMAKLRIKYCVKILKDRGVL